MHSYFALALMFLTTALSVAAQAADTFSVSCNGISGFDGRAGFGYGGSAPDGHKGFSPGGRGGDGQRGRDGGNATAPSAGGNACAIELLVELLPGDSSKIRISGRVGANEITEVIDRTEQTEIRLYARGGRGGNGAAGASGQDGGRGGEGGDAGQYSFSSGDGGRGGDGGAGGESSNGANGGNGGHVLVRLRKGQDALAPLVKAGVEGGLGGTRPIAFVRGGRGGQGGQPGNNCYFSSEGYKCVSRGFPGMSGMDGRSPISNSQPGQQGRPGTFELREID